MWLNLFGKSKNQIFVYIKQEPRDIVVSREIQTSSDGLKAYVQVEPATENRAGWKLDVSGAIRYNDRGAYVEAIKGAEKAIKFDLDKKIYTLSHLSNDEQQSLINLKIFKAHYGNILKDLLSALKPYIIILAIVVVISVAISGYNAYQLSKIPAIMYPIPAA